MKDEIKKIFKGDVEDDDKTLQRYSRDASLFEVRPEVVVFPKDVDDLKNLIKFVIGERQTGRIISLTARGGGTCMSGGPLSESIVLDFSRYFNRILGVGEGYATAQPGVFYRDFERETLKKGYFLPSYPASREICTVGGMVANNSGGEKTLKYGKTEDYILKLKVVFADGNEYEVRPLTRSELDGKMEQKDFEGELYRNIFSLIETNFDVLSLAKPKVSKNSAGYFLWNVWDRKNEIFDLTKLIVGSQGTLGFVTEITFRLVKEEPETGMLVVFMKDMKKLPEFVREVLVFSPTSFESFDDHTLRLSLKFFTGFLKAMGTNFISLAFQFLPEFLMVVFGGVPKLVTLVEFEEETKEEVGKKLQELCLKVREFGMKTRVVRSRQETKKYWAMRRESFNLLRHKIKDKQTAPFVDDIIVRPEYLSEFLPKLYVILDKYEFLYTIAGHVGDGNFHIIPLMKLSDGGERKKIFVATDEVYSLVLQYKGSITAEHNDGIMRTPYLEKMYGKEVCTLFEEVKKIFDSQNIFNPGKKVGGDIEYAEIHLKRG